MLTFVLQGSEKALRAMYYVWVAAKVSAMQGEVRGTNLEDLKELVELDIANSELEDDKNGLRITAESILLLEKIQNTAEFKRLLGDATDDIRVIQTLQAKLE